MKSRALIQAASAILGLIGFALLSVSEAPAQSVVSPCVRTSSTNCPAVSAAQPLPVTLSGSGSGGFAPSTTGTPISVTTGGVSGTLPAGAVVAAFNVGTTNTAYCKLGASSTTSDVAIPPASWFAFTVGSATQLTCITSTSTTTVNMIGGSGLPTGAGGGGGSGGLSVTDGAAFTEDTSAFTPTGCTFTAAADLAAGTQGTVRCNTKRAFVVDVDTSSNNLYSALTSAVPSGTNLIGDVNLRQGGTALSATNGAYANVLQGNAVLSTINPLPITADPCTYKAKTNLAISQNGTSSVQLIALSGSTVIYVCSLSLIAAGATTVAITTGTGSACVTGNAAVIGSTTANIANSLSFAANGGLTLGNGAGTVAQGAASGELCMINGSNVYVSGNLTYVQQ